MNFKVKLLITITGLALVSCGDSKGKQLPKNDTNEKVKIESVENQDSTTLDLTAQDLNEEDEKLVSLANEFKNKLSTGKNLHTLVHAKWSLIYHEDNRCDGATDGHLNDLPNTQIDETIKIMVKNDGDGWACDKKEPTSFDYNFQLGKEIETWDRFEISEYNNDDKTFYLIGHGESDYLKIHYTNFGKKHLIIKLEYRSEDPG